MKLLTPQEVLQALERNESVEVKLIKSSQWELLDKHSRTISLLVNSGASFRLVPEMITIGNISFPKPVTEKLPWQTVYYYPSLEREELCNADMWGNSGFDHTLLQRGLIHLTEEDAVEHAKALIKLSGGIPNQGTIFGC